MRCFFLQSNHCSIYGFDFCTVSLNATKKKVLFHNFATACCLISLSKQSSIQYLELFLSKLVVPIHITLVDSRRAAAKVLQQQSIANFRWRACTGVCTYLSSCLLKTPLKSTFNFKFIAGGLFQFGNYLFCSVLTDMMMPFWVLKVEIQSTFKHHPKTAGPNLINFVWTGKLTL